MATHAGLRPCMSVLAFELVPAAEKSHAGLSIWFASWRKWDAQLPPEIRTLAGADGWLGTAGAVKSWLGTELQTAILDHVTVHHCRAHESRALLLRLVERFADEPEDVRVNWKLGAGLCMTLVDERAAMERGLVGLLAEHPAAVASLMQR